MVNYWTQKFLDFDEVHKALFNEEGWRRSLTSPYHRFAQTRAPPNNYEPGDIGTLYHDYGDGTAHYMAFHVTGHRTVDLMDPSGNAGPYAPSPEERVLQRQQFPGYRIRHVFPTRGPQSRDADTLCQTWSLAWLMPECRQYVYEAATRTGAETAVEEITAILDTFRDMLSSSQFFGESAEKVRDWLSAYRAARPHLLEYFYVNVPHSTRVRRVDLFRS